MCFFKKERQQNKGIFNLNAIVDFRGICSIENSRYIGAVPLVLHKCIIFMYIRCVCVCVCVCEFMRQGEMLNKISIYDNLIT